MYLFPPYYTHDQSVILFIIPSFIYIMSRCSKNHHIRQIFWHILIKMIYFGIQKKATQTDLASSKLVSITDLDRLLRATTTQDITSAYVLKWEGIKLTVLLYKCCRYRWIVIYNHKEDQTKHSLKLAALILNTSTK